MLDHLADKGDKLDNSYLGTLTVAADGLAI